MKLNFSYRTELNCFESNWIVLNWTELFQFSFRTVSNGSVFFGSVQFSSSIQFLVFLPTPIYRARELWFFDSCDIDRKLL